MESKEDRLLSHYLWSLDNALSGLIELCTNKPDTADIIMKQVEDKLNVWNEHTNNLSISSNTAIVAWGDCSDDDNKQEAQEEEAPEAPKTPQDDLEAAWGDCSDEEDDEIDSFMLSEAVGLCKKSVNNDTKEEDDDDIDINIEIDITAKTEMDEKDDNEINIVHKQEEEEINIVFKDDDGSIKKEEADKKEEEEATDEEDDETMEEIENILSGTLFIDDTQINNNKIADKRVEKQVKNNGKLTWAQRTKKNNMNNVNDASYFMANSKLKKKSATKERSESPSNNVTNNLKTKQKKQKKKDDGWSRVYRSKKNKMQRRNSAKTAHGKNKTQQQRLSEAGEKKRAQILQRQQKHAEIFEHFHQKLFEKEVNEKKSILEKKKASKERLKKAEEKRKKSDLLRKEKAIKEDVRREEIRIYKEWQQREKKSAIVEKQVAAEIRKLKIAQKLTQKVSNTEQRVKNIARKQKLAAHKKKHAQKEVQTNKKSKRKKVKKKLFAPKKAHIAAKKEVLIKYDKISNENNEYFDCDIIKNGSAKYLSIPALNLVSTQVKDAMHHFYAKTNKLNANKFEEALAKLLKRCANIKFGDIHFNNDVLLAINRMTEFDVNQVTFKCSKLFIECAVLFSVNRVGCRLLCSKYLSKLLQFFKLCINEYIFAHNEAHQSILAQCCLVLSRLFNEMMKLSCESNTLFVQHLVSKYLFEIYNAQIFNIIYSVFKSITICSEYLDSLAFDGFISILIPIISILDEYDADDNNKIISQTIKQLNRTKCCGILNFMSKLVFYENPINEANEAQLSRESVMLLNGCMTCLNRISKMELIMVQNHVLEYEMEIYHIFIILLQFTCANFMKHPILKHERDRNRAENQQFERDLLDIRQLCAALLEFITFCARNNVQIQDMFRFISCNKPTLIKQLTQFPFFFFINNEGKLSLFPTLIAITQSNQENLEILKQTLNTKLIKHWIKQKIFEYIKSDHEKDDESELFVQKVPIQIWQRCLQIY